MSETETATTSSDIPSETIEAMEKIEEFPEPEAKRRKVSVWSGKRSDLKEKAEKLEQRLGGILCCAVCLDLPIAAVYQVCPTFLVLSAAVYNFQNYEQTTPFSFVIM